MTRDPASQPCAGAECRDTILRCWARPVWIAARAEPWEMYTIKVNSAIYGTDPDLTASACCTHQPTEPATA